MEKQSKYSNAESEYHEFRNTYALKEIMNKLEIRHPDLDLYSLRRKAKYIFSQKEKFKLQPTSFEGRIANNLDLLLANDEFIVRRIYESEKRTQHSYSDAEQLSTLPKLTLESLLNSPVQATIDLEDQKSFLEVEWGELTPIAEQIKKERIVTLNGILVNSKVSLIAHDVFDHKYTFALLKENGLLDKYEALLQAFGNPHLTNVFDRSSERIATIGFNYRSYLQHKDKPFTTAFDTKQIIRLLDKGSEKAGKNIEEAKLVLREGGVELRKAIEYIVTQVFIELLEETKKVGRVKILDQNGKINLMNGGI